MTSPSFCAGKVTAVLPDDCTFRYVPGPTWSLILYTFTEILPASLLSSCATSQVGQLWFNTAQGELAFQDRQGLDPALLRTHCVIPGKCFLSAKHRSKCFRDSMSV